MAARMPRHAASLALAAALLGCASTPAAPPPMMPARCPAEAADESGAQLVTRFYDAFARKDFRGMACCYHPEVEFHDSIFGTLKGKRAFAMWAMLVSRATDLRIQASGVQATGERGRAHWNAQYTFSFLMFSNRVENSIDAKFEFKDGKIYRHQDAFDLERWKDMALWPLGGVVDQDTVKKRVQSTLDDFIETHPEFQEPRR
jgi:hypothetical protein